MSLDRFMVSDLRGGGLQSAPELPRAALASLTHSVAYHNRNLPSRNSGGWMSEVQVPVVGLAPGQLPNFLHLGDPTVLFSRPCCTSVCLALCVSGPLCVSSSPMAVAHSLLNTGHPPV